MVLHYNVNSTYVLHRPQPGQIGAYKEALERLNTSIAFEAADLDLAAAVSIFDFFVSSLTSRFRQDLSRQEQRNLPNSTRKSLPKGRQG